MKSPEEVSGQQREGALSGSQPSFTNANNPINPIYENEKS